MYIHIDRLFMSFKYSFNTSKRSFLEQTPECLTLDLTFTRNPSSFVLTSSLRYIFTL
ncbi:hypothetical protein V1478_015014 [Vespula squamosa]|uniref:Uncharacterized protein n=1 Tax=Vespula squamosa TaxID=30214 RepID=A0ABD2A3Y4_VESSQ